MVPNEKGKLHSWEDEKWKVAKRSADARKESKNYQTSKYRTVIETLPREPIAGDGYHSKCYKNFTAISSHSVSKHTSSKDPKGKVLYFSSGEEFRERTSDRPSGIFPDICLFCEKKSKSRPDGTKELPGKLMTKQAAQKIVEVAHTLKLARLLVKISDIDLIAKEAQFHHSCRALYIRRADRRKSYGLEPIPEQPADAKTPLDHIYSYVQTNILDLQRPERLVSIYEQYCNFCTELEVSPTVGKAQYLGELLTRKFSDSIALQSPECRQQGVIVHSRTLDYNSIKTVYDFKSSPEGQVCTAALLLRRALKAVKKEPLSHPLTLESLKRGEGDPPKLVQTFFRTLLGGPYPGEHSESVKRRSDSFSQDVLFSVHKGTLKPRKHTMMGLTLKSQTGSRKIVTMLNRMGHSLNYHAVEELETELAYGILERKKTCPAGTLPGIPCGLAFDNYDELTHTLSGTETLHDTMGILYQNTQPSPQQETSELDVHASTRVPDDEQRTPTPTLPTLNNRKKRRRLDVPETTIAPYRKKPRMDKILFENVDFRAGPDLSVTSQKLDFLWMISHVVEKKNIPMWAGFNANDHTDSNPKQAVLYMPNIDRSPTNDDVVLETLSLTQKCAEECGQRYGVVTYDLDVAKRALKLQTTEAPKFDDVFVMFGAFHLEMCLFKAIGKAIKESGIAEMLVEAEVLASGSLNGFIECKNFNRCKRLHPMLALALEILHFLQFRESRSELDPEMDTVKMAIMSSESDIKVLRETPEFIRLFEEYSTYTRLTLNGDHGPTARFCIQYCKWVELYRIIDRAVRESDVDLYAYALTQAVDLFFGTNRLNYARWISKHQLDLINLTTTHPGLKEMLTAGLFSIRRSSNQFSRVPVDLTLEQTVNADAASRMTGYTDSTNNFTARLRWSTTKGARAAIISTMLEMAGMDKTGDIQAELTPSRITRDNRDLNKLLSTINRFANPFNLTTDSLLNIQTGKAASKEIADSLLTIEEKGRQKHDSFITECMADASRFEKSISQNKIKTFADQGAKNKRSSNTVIQELKCTRDLFGRIAFIAARRKVDLEYLLTHPLTPVPLTLCRTDGTLVTMAKGTKSDLLDVLESQVPEHGSPNHTNATVIDGNFLLHGLQQSNLPPTYGGLSRTLLNKVLSFPSKRIDILFDTYEEPSIKGSERQRRGAEDTLYHITGADQIRPRNIDKALKSTFFKQELPRFLRKDWSQQWHATSLENRQVYLGVDTECTLFSAMNGKVETTTIHHLECNHAEADTRICLHAIDADSTSGRTNEGDIVVRASDTDIAVILLHHCHRIRTNLWMDVGTDGRGNRRFINLTAVANEIGPGLCAALPGLHAFTGCDYTTAFIRKGKKRPLKIAEETPSFLNAFSALATETVDEATCESLKMYTAKLYGCKKMMPLNRYRYMVFQKNFGPKNENNPFAKIKGADASCLPPCENVIQQKIYRSNFVARQWHASYTNTIPKEPTLGWELSDNSYQIVWFTGPQMPSTVVPDSPDFNDSDDDDNGTRPYFLSDTDVDDDDADEDNQDNNDTD